MKMAAKPIALKKRSPRQTSRQQHPKSNRHAGSTSPHAKNLSSKIDTPTAESARADRASDARISILVVIAP